VKGTSFAITQWQRVLDAHPTAQKYKELEKKVEDLLALSPEATQFAAAVKACSAELWTLMPGAMSRARRADGRGRACASRSTRSTPPAKATS
jgi:hypothetical protein